MVRKHYSGTWYNSTKMRLINSACYRLRTAEVLNGWYARLLERAGEDLVN